MTTYAILPPMIIGPRLMPAIRIDDGHLYVQAHGIEPDGRTHWRAILDTPAGSYESDDSFVTLAGTNDGPDQAESPDAEATAWGILAARAAEVACDGFTVEYHTPAPDWIPASIAPWVVAATDAFTLAREELIEAVGE